MLGGKADSLKTLKVAGFNVPDFIVIDRLDFPTRERIFEFVSESPEKKYAVRSSANLEDGKTNSFAGIFESYLNLSSEVEILKAIEKCFFQLNSKRAIEYCRRKNIDHNQLKMNVIIQEMVPSEFSGVAFSLNPINGKDEEFLVEITRGLGDKLVSGHCNPERWLLSRWNENALLSVEGPKSGISEGFVNSIRDLISQIQSLFGRPQDIEWAVYEGKVFVLQSRSITAFSNKEEGEWTNADFRDGGVSSGVVSPIMWSLYEKIFSTSLPKYFLDLGLISSKTALDTIWYRVFYGRPYWNLKAVKDIQATLPGFVERNFDLDLAIHPGYKGDGIKTGFSFQGLFRALSVLIKLRKGYHQHSEAAERLLEKFPLIEKKYQNANWSQLGESDFRLLARMLLEVDYQYVETIYFNTIYNASNAKMEFFDSFNKLKARHPSLDYIKLISDIGVVSATQSAVELWNIVEKNRVKIKERSNSITSSEVNTEFSELGLKTYIEKFYYHSARELDLLVPRWGEDPTLICEIVAKHLNTNKVTRNPSELANVKKLQCRSEFESLRYACKTKFSFGQPSVIKKLNRLRKFLWLREEVRDRSTRMYYFIRQMLLELGRRTEFNELIFYLTLSELLGIIDGQSNRKEILTNAQKRRLYAQGYNKFQAKNEIGGKYERYVEETISFDSANLSGIASSPGKYRGRARILYSPDQAGKLNSGDILVAPFSDPGWTPLFSLVGAVITETGGLLSHAALISREYGIPSVLNVNGATQRIADGQMIEVDGTAGTIRIIKDGHA